MIKIQDNKPQLITLVKGNKKIQRTFTDYKTNQKMWEFRGFKIEENTVKENNSEVDKTYENETKVVKLKPKKKAGKKKNVQPDLEND